MNKKPLIPYLQVHPDKRFEQSKFVLLTFFIFLLIGCYKEQTVPVTAQFSITVLGNKYSVPVKVQITNITTGADTYTWTLAGASPATSNSKDPGTIEYDTPGNYSIVLLATNKSGGTSTKTLSISIDPDVVPSFKAINTKSYYPDVSLQIVNTSTGASGYQWTFSGGVPASSTQVQPGNVVFSAPGNHLISLIVTNGKETYTKDTTIVVKPDLVAAFDITWPNQNNDMQVPFTAIMKNNCVSATTYNWSFGNANPSTSTDSVPKTTYQVAGTYTISLTAGNDKKTASISKTITLLPNSNLYSFTDVKMGINTAENTLGVYFSSKNGRVLKGSEINASNGASIDFVFYGLNSNFTYNKILSPDSVQHYTFNAIPNAIKIQIINSQELCNCGTTLTADEYDAISNGADFNAISINQTNAGLLPFNNSFTPRIVLFQTNDGRKGAVKIKQFIQAGLQSYIICDIKIMKQP